MKLGIVQAEGIPVKLISFSPFLILWFTDEKKRGSPQGEAAQTRR